MQLDDLAKINLNLLVALAALLDEKSVKGAAARTRVTQSAMSHSLRQLRQIFDDELLVRTGKGMQLSPLAERIRPSLQQSLSQLHSEVLVGHTFEPATSARTFRISAADYPAAVLGPRLVQSIQSSAPQVCIEFEPEVRIRHTDDLAEGNFDLVIAGAVPQEAGTERMPLFTDSFCCAVRRDHPRAKRETLDLETYCSMPHAVISLGGSRGPTWVDEVLAEHGLVRRIAVYTRHFMLAPLLVARGDLLITGPRLLLEPPAEALGLQIFEPPLALPSFTYHAIWHVRFSADPGHRWLRDRLSESAAEFEVGDDERVGY
jgi:DNA-binding transcriptional LysR family regulator